MFFQRFYDTKLAQASYLIGCQRTGEAVVVDPNRDVGQYVDAAAKEGLRVTHVTETHIHADFVSGARELARHAGAQLLLSDEGGEGWRYAYAAESGARLLEDGDHVMVGNVRLDVLHTPGHTPEHLSFLVTDTPAGAGAWGVLTGDFVFVGDVGRPDLLEKVAGHAGTMEASARTLFHSLARFRALPDRLQLWPGHGAGSACGKALGAVPSSTVGYEKIANWGVASTDEERFVAEVLAGQPEPPPYFARMKRVNRDGPPLGGIARPSRLPAARLAEASSSGRSEAPLLVDLRPVAAFAAGHLPRALNIPYNASFTTWSGWLLPDDRDLHLIADGEAIEGAVRDLAMIGLDRVSGWFDAEAVAEWGASGGRLETVPQTSAAELAARLARGEVHVVDVRARSEWEKGHLPDVVNVPLGELPRRLAELPTDKPLVLHCQGGTRSAIGASVLQAAGVTQVVNLAGGFEGWRNGGGAVQMGAEGEG